LIVVDGTSSNAFFILFIVEACFCALTTLLIVFIFQSEPPSPPSSSEKHHLQINIKKDLRSLLINRQYLIMLFSFSIGFALFNAITTLLDELIQPNGYSSTDAGIFGAIIIIAGLLHAFVIGFIMDRTHAYRLLLKVLLAGACVSGIYFILILQPNQFYPLAVSIGLMGFFLLPLLPVSFECAVECTYPIRAEWSTGLLLCTGNVLGGIFIYILGALINLAPLTNSGVIITPASIFILCSFVISALVLLTYKGPYLRFEAERRLISTTSMDNIHTIDTIALARMF
jgi:nitrate/nitrite transporter NarK